MKYILNILFRIVKFISSKIFRINTIAYWNQRARKYGSRAVINLAHDQNEYLRITEYQKSILFPVLCKEFNGSEHMILDFGCGPARFTYDLAKLINGKCIGVDPIEFFLPKSVSNVNVEFKTYKKNILPINNDNVDIIWICLVLGGITVNRQLRKVISELNRVLKKGGLIFLVENIEDKSSTSYWIYRTVEEYIKMFSFFCILKERGFYFDNGEKISILAGRKY